MVRIWLLPVVLAYALSPWNAPARVAKREAVAGGPRGGAIEAIVFDLKDSTVIYAATDWSGVFKTTDSGQNWTAINTGLTRMAVYSLAIDPLSAATLYAGTARGVFKTVDAGGSWISSRSGLPITSAASIITMLAIDPAFCSLFIDRSNPTVLYATASSDGKAFKRTNGGDSWEERRFGFPRLGGCGVVMNPADSSILYATATTGTLKGRDGGKSWQKFDAGSRTFARLWTDDTSLVIDPATSVLYAGSSAGVFKSLDRGETWTTVSTTSPTSGLRRLLLDPVNPSIIYAQVEVRGVFKSTNGGQSWKPINSGLPDLSVRGLVIDPPDSSTLYVGTFKRGVFKSTNSGESWQPTGSKE